jgi:hypothetical protein
MIPVGINIQLPDNIGWLARILWLFRKKHYQLQLPESWEEVPSKMFWKIIRHYLMHHQLSKHAFLLLILKEMLDIPTWVFKRISSITFLEQLLPRIKWVEKLSYSKPFDKTIMIGGCQWRIPVPLAKDMTLQQYFLLERTFSELFTNREKDAADFLAAFLRPDTRQLQSHYYQTGLLPTVSSPELENYATTLASADEKQVLYLVQYYINMRLQLKEKYPALHDGNNDGRPDKIDWDSIAPSIAETGVFGSLNQVLKTPAVNYLAWANARQESTKPKPQTLQEMIRSNHQKILN